MRLLLFVIALMAAAWCEPVRLRGQLKVVQTAQGCTKSVNCWNGRCGHTPGLWLRGAEGLVRLDLPPGQLLKSYLPYHGRSVVVEAEQVLGKAAESGEQAPAGQALRAGRYRLVRLVARLSANGRAERKPPGHR